MRYKPYRFFPLIILICIFAVLAGLMVGSTSHSWRDLLSIGHDPILQLRAARVALALVVVMGLGASGVALQAILRNPLAEPYLLGTSSGAGLGAILAIMFGLTSLMLPAAAFAGAIISILLVYAIAQEHGRISVQSLILSGVIIGITLSGIIVFLSSISSQRVIHGMMWWLLGNLEVYDMGLLSMIAAVVIVGVTLLMFLSRDLNAITLGEDEALHLGVDCNRLKKWVFVLTALVTGAIVSVSGLIGFVGLIVPHTMRLIVGPNHKVLLPATCIASGAFLVICDMLSRTLFSPTEIPIGVMTSFIGTPIFIILLKQKLPQHQGIEK